ncbi:hypothetical protein DK45_2244 [Bordetella bronchiseptica]|nr:hypothetical protein DK45_2244 [Bordetella bronchiseptica]
MAGAARPSETKPRANGRGFFVGVFLQSERTHMPNQNENELKRYAVIDLDGRPALCEVRGKVIEAASWKEARKMIKADGELPEGI